MIKKDYKILVGSMVVVICAVLFTTTLAHSVWLSPSDEVTVDGDLKDPRFESGIILANSADGQTVDTAPSQDVLPTRLKIPSLNIDANVQHVGVGKSGSMAVPTNFTDVGWYRHGTVPGYLGSAVFDGHVDNGLALAGVFKHLVDIQPGADVYVTRGDGKDLHFKVTSVDLYDYKNVPTDQIFRPNDKAYIRLITCNGSWVAGDKTYNKRLVVSGILME